MRSKAPHAAIFRHCDGSIRKIIPDFIEIGIDVLNPVQTSAKDMNGKVLKESFGAQLTFHGAIEKMDSDRDTLLTEVKEKIDTFAPGGGYIFSSCNHMINVPPENILLMFETARQYGKYPRP
jgi:uroporphyrinogen decarboxylase